MAARLLLLVLFCSLGVVTARADEPPPADASEPVGYGDAVEAALSAHERGEYEVARAHLLRAHEIFPNARTLRGLGKVEYELSNYVEALGYFEAALASEQKPLDSVLRADVEELVRRAREHVGEVRIEVDPPSAAVVIDSTHTQRGPDVTLRLPAGDHVLEFRAQGRRPEQRPLRIKGGEQTSLTVVLHPMLAVVPAPAPLTAPAHDDEPRRLRRNPWLWTAVGVLVAGAAVSLALTVRRDEDIREGEPVVTPNTLPGVVLGAGR